VLKSDEVRASYALYLLPSKHCIDLEHDLHCLHLEPTHTGYTWSPLTLATLQIPLTLATLNNVIKIPLTR
jgi:hypothetical protein